MDVGVLGPLEVRSGGRAVEVRRGLPRVLLADLVLNRGRVVAFDALVEHLWGDNLPAKPANALQTQVAYLRRTLGGTASAPIRTRPSGYVLDVPAEAVDAWRFEHLVARAARLAQVGTSGSATDALAAYDAALGLWRGLAYEDAADRPFAQAEAARLEELRVRAAEERISVLLDLGRASEAAADLAALTAAHPLRERLHEQHVLALYRAGRQAEALRAYDAARRTLAEELGLGPGPSLRKLERQVLDQAPELDWLAPAGHDAGSTAADGAPDPSSPAPRPELPPRLVGRDDDLVRIGQALANARLLTLTGPGGAGKTTLALAVVAAQAGARPVLFADLAPVVAGRPVAATVAAAVGCEAPDGEGADAVVARLAGSGAILVLDTCEHVAAGAAALAQQVVERCPGVTVVATSRRPLRARGELVWPVSPLRLPGPGEDPASSPAVQLFVERAGAVAPALDLTPAALDHVAAICRSLDGLPLAIELAATHADVYPPEVMRTQLADRLHLLPGPGAAGPERHRTLQAALEWSTQLLDPAQRELLEALAVVVGSFDLDAAAGVAGTSPAEAAAALAGLVRCSLVAPDAPGRYRLPDTVRAHALNLAAGPGLAERRRRHALHFAGVADGAFAQVRGPGQRPWITRLRADRANLLAALDWAFGPDGDERLGARLAGAVAWVWTLDGQLRDARHALERAERVEGVEPLVRARVLLGVGLLAAPLGDLARAREVCLESALLARSAGAPGAAADALITLGVAQWGVGDLEEAAATHDEAIALFEEARNRWGATVCRILRARTAADLGDLALAGALLDVAVDAARATGDAHVVGLACDQLARLALARGDLDGAERAAREGLVAAESIGYAEGVVAGLAVLGRVQAERGETGRSRAHHLQALEVATRIGHASAQCEALEAIAALDAAVDPDGAALLLLQAGRARERRSLPRPAAEAVRVSELRERVRAAVGARWDGMERLLPLTSFDDTVRQLLGGPGAP